MHSSACQGFLQAAAPLLALMALAESCSRPGSGCPESQGRRWLQRARSRSSVSSFAFGFPIRGDTSERVGLLHIFHPASQAAEMLGLQPILLPPAAGPGGGCFTSHLTERTPVLAFLVLSFHIPPSPALHSVSEPFCFCLPLHPHQLAACYLC